MYTLTLSLAGPSLLLFAVATAQVPLLHEQRRTHLPDEPGTGSAIQPAIPFATDVDGDRALDLVVQTRAGGQRLWHNLGQFRFVDVTTQSLPVGTGLIRAALDADGDGDLDLVASPSLLRNRGGGLFVAEPLPRPFDLAVSGDIDGDGDQDIVVAAPNAVPLVHDLLAFVNDGSGRFASVLINPQPAPRQMLLGDLDRNGTRDLVVFADTSTSNTRIMHNDGTGRFTLGALLTTVPEVRVQLADFDGDGAPDFVTPRRLLRNNNGVAFVDETAQRVPGHVGRRTLAAVDADRDGDIDLLSAQGDATQVLVNNGRGLFAARADSVLGRPPAMGDLMSAGDLDGDGHADLVSGTGTLLAGRSDGRFAVLDMASVGQRNVVAVADFDGNGDADLLERGYAVGLSYIALRNDGGAHFAPVASTQALAIAPVSSAEAVGDVDGDGDLDVVASSGSPGFSLVTMRNDGAGRFAATTAPFATTGDAVDLYLADVDGDRDLDAVGVHSDAVFVASNDGSGAFRRSAVWGGATRASAFADYDGDGDPDLLLAYDRLALLENRGGLFVEAPTGQVPSGFGRPQLVAVGGRTWLLWTVAGAVDVYERTASGLASRPALGITFRGEVLAARLLQVGLPGAHLGVTYYTAAGTQSAVFAFDGVTALRDITSTVLPRECADLLSAGDLDGDGDVDLLGDVLAEDFRVFRGQTRALRVPFAPQIGGSLDLVVRDTTAVGPTLAICLAGAVTRLPIPGFGVLRIDPRAAVTLPALTLDSQRESSQSVLIPRNVALRDVELGAQFVHVQGGGTAFAVGPMVRETIR